MSIYDIIHPEGLGETNEDGLSNILRFGCFEFMLPGERQCVECTCGVAVGYSSERKKLGYGCPSHPNYVVIDSNFGDFPTIKNQKSDLEEGFCSQQPKLGSRTINIKGVILEHGLCLDNLIQRMKMQLSCLKDTLYVQIGAQHFKTEAEITSFKLDGDTFDITFCAQPYYEDDTKYVLEHGTLDFLSDSGSFEVSNLWASTYPEIKIEVKDGRGGQLNISYGDTELKIYGEFNTGDIICIDGITGEAKNGDTLLHYDGCFEQIKNKVKYTFNISFDELTINPNEEQNTECSSFDVLGPYLGSYGDSSGDDVSFIFPVDVKNIDCIQKVLINATANLMRGIGSKLDVTLNIYSDSLFTNQIGTGSYNYTHQYASSTSVQCLDFPIYFNSVDVSNNNIIYFEYIFDLTKSAGNLGNASWYAIGSGGIVDYSSIKIYHNKTKDYCLCGSGDRCYQRNFGPTYSPGTSFNQFGNSIEIGQVVDTPKRYFNKLSLYINKTIGYPDVDITLNVYTDDTKTSLVVSQKQDLFQGVAYDQACFQFDDLVETINSNYFFEFIINSFGTPVTGQRFEIHKSRADDDVWIDGVKQTGLEGLNGVYFDLQCTDVFSETETFEVSEFCLDYSHKNRYV